MDDKWPEPAWLSSLPAKERPAARVRYFLNLAAAYHNKQASLTVLSKAIGFHESYLNSFRARGRVPAEGAVRIEQLLGREHFQRELFNEIFVVAER